MEPREVQQLSHDESEVLGTMEAEHHHYDLRLQMEETLPALVLDCSFLTAETQSKTACNSQS